MGHLSLEVFLQFHEKISTGKGKFYDLNIYKKIKILPF